MENLKEMTKKDYARRMDRVLDYIQDNLDDDVSLDTLANVACFSSFHFHRVFRGMVGESVKFYTRRLRLERAAGKLKRTDAPVTMIAFEAGFETHESFTRAFHRMFGISPFGYRQSNQTVINQKNIEYWRTINMDVTIVELEDMDVVYIRHVGPYNQCGAAWDKLCQWAAPQGLLQPGTKMLGISFDDPEVTPVDKLRYDACIEVASQVQVQAPISEKRIQGGRYAMGTHIGPYDTLADTYAKLCGQWVPQNNHELDNRGCLEIYQNSPEDTDPKDLITDIYIPLK